MEIVMRWIVSAAVAAALSGVAYSLPLASPPVANDDFVFLEGGSGLVSLSPLDNDSEPDGDALRIVGLTGPGSEFAQVSENNINFVAPDGFYSMTYTVEDSEGLQSTASILVIVLTFLPVCGLVECSQQAPP
jgi:large repetitive protein